MGCVYSGRIVLVRLKLAGSQLHAAWWRMDIYTRAQLPQLTANQLGGRCWRWESAQLWLPTLLPPSCSRSCVGFILGDLLAQHLGHGGAGGACDLLRAARLGAFGLAIDGPLGAAWYDLLVSSLPLFCGTLPCGML